MQATQNILSPAQLEAFYHSGFVDPQVRNFKAMVLPVVPQPRVIVDIGGGCGFFAGALQPLTAATVRVLDLDAASIAACIGKGLEAVLGDALTPPMRGDEDVACFNMVLHHLVGTTDASTLAMQKRALCAWHRRAKAIFVDEYIYDSYMAGAAGRLIYEITSSRLLSSVARAVSRFVPSLRANTFGVGVRFRGHDEWRALFESLGFRVSESVRGVEEPVSFPQRLLFIKSRRRDSFLLIPLQTSGDTVGT